MGLAYCLTASWWTPNLADWRSQELGSMGQLNHDDQITVGTGWRSRAYGDEAKLNRRIEERAVTEIQGMYEQSSSSGPGGM
ncbi:hypothetical protein AgCh_038090 [Apium graveolens]